MTPMIVVGLKYDEISRHYAKIYDLVFDGIELRRILEPLFENCGLENICPEEETGYLDYIHGYVVLELTNPNNNSVVFYPHEIKYDSAIEDFKFWIGLEPKIFLTSSY